MRYSIYKKLVLNDERSEKLIFEPDGRTFYVYRITNIELNEHYYGSRNAVLDNLLEDLKKYGSTSKQKLNIINNNNNYRFKIIRTFDNPGDKIIFESYLHKYFDVKNHNKFFNEANQTPFGFDTSGVEPWNKGKTGLGGYHHSGPKRIWSEEHKQKLSIKMMGHKKASTKNYSNVSKDMVVVIDKEGNKTKIKKENWDRNTHKSVMEGTLTATDISTNIKTRISKYEFNNNKLLIANGSKWFYEINGIGYRNSDLLKLMKSLNISCSIQTYKKRIKKITLEEYSSLIS